MKKIKEFMKTLGEVKPKNKKEAVKRKRKRKKEAKMSSIFYFKPVFNFLSVFVY